MIPEFKFKVLKNPKKENNLNYYVMPPTEFEIFSAYIDNINDNNIILKLNLKQHLYIKTLLDNFTDKVHRIDLDLNPNCYFRKDENDENFIIRIVNIKKFQVYKNTVCNLKLRIKNIWQIDDKSGTIFELLNFTEKNT
jgi:hypothetical protein